MTLAAAHAVTTARSVAMVVPADADDPTRPSGGNTYDRRLRAELGDSGWTVSWRGVAGDWPTADARALVGLGQVLADLPDDSVVLVDGLVACGAPDAVLPATARLRLVVLVHMPLGHRPSSPLATALEGAVLRAAHAVVVTSEWSRRWLLGAYALPPSRVHVAPPGTDPAPVSPGTDHGGNLLCVASVTPGKGHDVLVGALPRLADLDWRCECVGALGRAPDFVARMRRDVEAAGLSPRFAMVGPRTGDALEASYAAADLLVLASRAETWGMVVTEALAHGIPVVATDVGGVPEALGTARGGGRPGVLLPQGDELALAEALRAWLAAPGLRHELRSAARQRRTELTGWGVTAGRVAALLAEVAA